LDPSSIATPYCGENRFRAHLFSFRIGPMKQFLALLLLLCSVWLLPAEPASFKRTEDVIYGRTMGTSLTLDVFQPTKPNGIGIVFLVSGGWFSSRDFIAPAAYDSFLSRGYTVFTVVHGSQPKFQIPEIIEHVQRAVRFVRFHAKTYGIDPERLGVTGGSAGGHLSLMLGAHPIAGKAEAKDPVDRESSAVQCVACFFPPTDFLNYGKPGERVIGDGILAPFKPAFGQIPKTDEGKEKYGREISPLYFVTSNMPPACLIHGDADKLVPYQQSEIFVERCKEMGVPAKLITKKGLAHGWPDWIKDMSFLADWFDLHLQKGGKSSADGAGKQP
jgi:acetyl esterase/lipase